jgi:hypothetical protein
MLVFLFSIPCPERKHKPLESNIESKKGVKDTALELTRLVHQRNKFLSAWIEKENLQSKANALEMERKGVRGFGF